MNKKYLLGFIFCSAGSFYGGNPNEFILIHLFVTVYFVFLTLIKSNLDLKGKFNFLLSYIWALILSVLLTSAKLIPFVEFWKNAVSGRMGGFVGISDFLPFKKFLAWILYPNQMFEGPNYFGYLIISLMFYSLFNLARNKWRLREKIVAFHFILLFLIISKIIAAPYIHWLGTLPIFQDINYRKYCSLIYYLISVISAFSLIYLTENIKRKKDKIIQLIVFLFCCAVPHIIFLSISRKSLFQIADGRRILLYISMFFILVGFFIIIIKKTYKNKVITSSAVIIIMLLAVCGLRLNNHQNYRKRFKINDEAPYTQFLLKQKPPYRSIGINGTFSPNCNLVYPIPTINRMFAMRIMRPTLLLYKLISGKFDSGMGQIYLKDEILNNPYLDLLNTKYYISESVINSIEINPDYAKSYKIGTLLNNPSMKYTRCGNLYYYAHQGWQQLSDSSVDIPIHLPFGDVNLKSTALAFNFDWSRRESPRNRLHLIISVKQGGKKEVVFHRTFVAHRKKDQDFLSMEVNLSKYSGQDVILNFNLSNPGARNKSDRIFFFGDLRITYDKIKKSLPRNSNTERFLRSAFFETVPYEDVFSHHAFVYKNNRALDRGFMLYNIKKIEDFDEAIRIMKKEPLMYKDTALIEGDYPENMKIGKRGQSKISFLDYKPNYVKIDVETTENGVFVLSDAYYPGWRAYLNKKRVRIYPAFCALRAVFLPKGKHELIFCYRPWTFYLGAILTILTGVFLGYLFFRFKYIKS